VGICRNKNDIRNADLMVANGLMLPYREGIFDYVLSIAVIHHLESAELRGRFLREIWRCLKPGGVALVTVWAAEQVKKKKWVDLGGGDFLVPWTDRESGVTYNRFYHLFDRAEVQREFGENMKGVFHILDVSYECCNYCVLLKKRSDKDYIE
jgi:tRNA (uracil-5-)-methyltransferase TRM9